MSPIVLIVLILAGLGISFSLFMVFGLIIRNIYFHYKYKDDRGWWKCVDCGEAPETVYYESTFWGRIHKCDNCTKWDEL